MSLILRGPVVECDNAAELSAYSIVGLDAGVVSYLRSFRDYFQLTYEFDGEVDGKTAIRARNNAVGAPDQNRAVWQRLNIPHPSWMRQAAWYVDPSHPNASDEWTGLFETFPLATDGERQRRWGLGRVSVIPAGVAVSVYYKSAPTDKVNYDVMYMDGASLRVVGTPTVSKSGTLSAVTTLSRPTPWDVTGGTLGAADEGKILRIPSGARANNYAGIAKDLTGNKVRIGPCGNLNITTAVSTGPCYTGVTPVSSDPFEVITVPILSVGSINVRSGTNSVPTSTPANCVVFDNVQLDGTGSGAFAANGSVGSYGGTIFYRGCVIKNMWIRGNGAHYFAGGIFTGSNYFIGNFSVFGGPYCQALGFVQSGGFMHIQVGTSVQLGGDCLFQAAPLNVRGQVYGEFVGAYDCAIANFAVQIHDTGHYLSFPITSADLLYGTGNAGTGVKVFTGGKVTYNTKPTINTSEGAGRQSLIGGTNKDWSAVPFAEANGAMIVARA